MLNPGFHIGVTIERLAALHRRLIAVALNVKKTFTVLLPVMSLARVDISNLSREGEVLLA